MALSAITRQALSALQSSADVAALGGLDAVVRALGTDVKRGLPAAQVTANREAFGENKLPSKQPRSFFSHLKEAFEDTTLKILVASAAFSMLFGVFLSDKTADVIQGMAIVAAVVIVSGVNSFQNWSKDREFQSLAKLKADRPVQVLRDGQEVRDLVRRRCINVMLQHIRTPILTALCGGDVALVLFFFLHARPRCIFVCLRVID